MHVNSVSQSEGKTQIVDVSEQRDEETIQT